MKRKKSAKAIKKPKYKDPTNPYTGEVSVLTIMENISNGFTKFPKE